MNLRTYLMIKRAADEAAADTKAEAPKSESTEKKGPKQLTFGQSMRRLGGNAMANIRLGAGAHPYYTALGATGGALLGGGLGYGTAELAGLSGDDLSTAGRLGRYALIGGGALTGGLAGGLGTAAYFGPSAREAIVAQHAASRKKTRELRRAQNAIAAADPEVVAQDYIP